MNTRKAILFTKGYLRQMHSFSKATETHDRWNIYLGSEYLWDGRAIKTLTITDDQTKQVLGVLTEEPGSSLNAYLVTGLTMLKGQKKLPQAIVFDHSSLISIELDLWCKTHQVKQVYVHAHQPVVLLFLKRFMLRRRIGLDMYSR